jgi:organic radical activating enzyme
MPVERDLEVLKFKDGMLKISGDGAFYTLQGEGPSMGSPAVFLRLHKCNLQCVWCDTPYTWKKDDDRYWTESKDLTIKESADMLRQTWGAENLAVQKRAVFTGGEPLLQQSKIELLADELGPEWKIEIETNGTVMPSDKMLGIAQFNCSPKLANSENNMRARVRPDVIRKLATGNTTFKFVVTAPEELDEIERDYIQGCGVPIEKVILMPEGTSAEAIHEHALLVSEYAKQKGYRMLGRMQVDIWGSQRKT